MKTKKSSLPKVTSPSRLSEVNCLAYGIEKLDDNFIHHVQEGNVVNHLTYECQPWFLVVHVDTWKRGKEGNLNIYHIVLQDDSDSLIRAVISDPYAQSLNCFSSKCIEEGSFICPTTYSVVTKGTYRRSLDDVDNPNIVSATVYIFAYDEIPAPSDEMVQYSESMLRKQPQYDDDGEKIVDIFPRVQKLAFAYDCISKCLNRAKIVECAFKVINGTFSYVPKKNPSRTAFSAPKNLTLKSPDRCFKVKCSCILHHRYTSCLVSLVPPWLIEGNELQAWIDTHVHSMNPSLYPFCSVQGLSKREQRTSLKYWYTAHFEEFNMDLDMVPSCILGEIKKKFHFIHLDEPVSTLTDSGTESECDVNESAVGESPVRKRSKCDADLENSLSFNY